MFKYTINIIFDILPGVNIMNIFLSYFFWGKVASFLKPKCYFCSLFLSENRQFYWRNISKIITLTPVKYVNTGGFNNTDQRKDTRR
jgi:hypothetical protein